MSPGSKGRIKACVWLEGFTFHPFRKHLRGDLQGGTGRWVQVGHVLVEVGGRWEGRREFWGLLSFLLCCRRRRAWLGGCGVLCKRDIGPKPPTLCPQGCEHPGDAWGVSRSLTIRGWGLPWDLGWGETDSAHVSSTVTQDSMLQTEVLVSELGQHKGLTEGVWVQREFHTGPALPLAQDSWAQGKTSQV